MYIYHRVGKVLTSECSSPEKMHPADPAHGERTYSAGECAVDCADRNGVNPKAVPYEAVIHVGDAYRARGVRLGKSLCNPGLDEPVHKGIGEEQENQHAEEHDCSSGNAHIRRYLRRGQRSSISWSSVLLHVLYLLTFSVTSPCACSPQERGGRKHWRS